MMISSTGSRGGGGEALDVFSESMAEAEVDASVDPGANVIREVEEGVGHGDDVCSIGSVYAVDAACAPRKVRA
jgi:hypothetical protein